MKQQFSLRRRLLLLVFLIWMVPVLSIYFFVTVSYRNDIIEKSIVLMEEGIRNFTYFSAQKIDEAIDISRKTSYEQVIETAWKEYTIYGISQSELYRLITQNLTSKFYNDSRFEIAVFYLSEEPDRIYYTKQKESNYIDIYRNEVAETAHKITMQDTTEAFVEVINGKIYIIRNLYTTTNYTKFGTLILELNKDKLIDGITFNKDYEFAFFINHTDSIITYHPELKEASHTELFFKLKDLYSNQEKQKLMLASDDSYTGMLYQKKFDDFHFGALLVASQNVLFSELEELYRAVFLIMMIIIPVIIYMLYFISHHITKPMDTMITAAKTLEKGNIGMQIEGKTMPNKEFYVLEEAFNKMSSEIKYLFDYAYSEQLARKDAKIIALQSQINPHFLNNTLEMMNWQARMASDVVVSKMIEALGTLLNYSMDRSNRKLINLAEELRCVDAYCYLISMRFGKRLKIEKDVDNDLLQIMVPQLILQPLIENAVVHGVETVKNGTIKIRVFHDNKNIFLQIVNSGKNMTTDDLERVTGILNEKREQTPKAASPHESLGIRNVNERIKLIYGEEYGLTIQPAGEGQTASTITLPLEFDSDREVVKGPELVWMPKQSK